MENFQIAQVWEKYVIKKKKKTGLQLEDLRLILLVELPWANHWILLN